MARRPSHPLPDHGGRRRGRTQCRLMHMADISLNCLTSWTLPEHREFGGKRFKTEIKQKLGPFCVSLALPSWGWGTRYLWDPEDTRPCSWLLPFPAYTVESKLTQDAEGPVLQGAGLRWLPFFHPESRAQTHGPVMFSGPRDASGLGCQGPMDRACIS